MIYPALQISIAIARPPQEIYEFAANPENLPQWAAGLSGATIEKSGDSWLAESPMGKVKIKFAERNSFGVMDHEVTLPDGTVNHNPFRVVKNGSGGELIFTLYRLPQMSDADFQADADMIRSDLKKIKALLER